MTRENMFVEPQRESWMTEEREKLLRAVAKDNVISCAQVQKFAQDNGIELKKMKSFVDVLGIKVTDCRLGCF